MYVFINMKHSSLSLFLTDEVCPNTNIGTIWQGLYFKELCLYIKVSPFLTTYT